MALSWGAGSRAARSRCPLIDFDLKFMSKGSNRIDKLQVINRGTETAYDVELSVPEDAALSLHWTGEIQKIPGGGKSVTIDAMNENRTFGARHANTFDVSIKARTKSGEAFSQEVFLDMNG